MPSALELDDRVPPLADPRPILVALEELGPRGVDHEDRRLEVFEEIAEQRERVVVRRVEILEDEADRRVRGVRLEERLEDGAADRVGLLQVVRDRAGERALVAAEAEELAEKIDDVADLAIVEDLGDLSADLDLRRVDVHPLDEPESAAEQPREQAERGDGVARASLR